MEHAHPTLPRHRDGHSCFRNRVHGAGYQRQAHGDIPCHVASRVDVTGDDCGFSREQQDVVESQPAQGKLAVVSRALHGLRLLTFPGRELNASRSR